MSGMSIHREGVTREHSYGEVVDHINPATHGADGVADPMTDYECNDCGVAGMDISQEGVDPDFWFERGADGVMRCGGCEAIQSANRRFEAGDW